MSGSAVWFTSIGALLIGMTIISASLKRLPLTAAVLYLLVGIALGGLPLERFSIDLPAQATPIRLLAEVAVIISLFTAGLKLRLPLKASEWRAPLLLATASMVITIALVAAFAHLLLGFSWGGAVLLGAILAPTDPVLAAGVQVTGPEDHDRLRFSLTGEAGLNDGTALPFAVLGLSLLKAEESTSVILSGLAFDVLWGIAGGIGLGTLLGSQAGRLVEFLRKRHHETTSLDDFLALGLVALSYGIALVLHTNGFLAVFATGLALRRRERSESRSLQTEDHHRESLLRTDTVSGRMARGLLDFNEQMDRFAELIVVVFIGVLVARQSLRLEYVGVALFLLVCARPVSVFLGMLVERKSHKVLLAWFGIRGVGSLFYLAFAIEHGVPAPLADQLIGIVLTVVAASILIHGISAAPLMIRHTRKQRTDNGR